MKDKGQQVEVEVQDEGEEYPRKYIFRTYKGDINVSVNAGRGATVNINTGQAPPDPRPPKG